MTLEKALEASAVNQVLRKLDGEHFRPKRPGAKRPYSLSTYIPGGWVYGQYQNIYEPYIFAFSNTQFCVVENFSMKVVGILEPKDSWQVIGKDDWEPL